MKRLLEALADFSRRRYRLVLAVTALVLLLSGIAISRLRLDADVLNLVPKNDPVINAYLETLREFGTFDYLMVLVEIPQDVAVDPYTEFADRLAERLVTLPEIESVDHRIEAPEKLLEQLLPQSLLFLDAAGREEVAARVTPEGIRARVAELRRRLGTPQSIVLRDLVRLDPLGLSEVLIQRVESSRGGMAVDWTSGYFLSQDQQLLLLVVKPKRPPQDIDFNQAMLDGIRQAVATTSEEFVRDPNADNQAAPRVRVGGAHVSALEDASVIKGDMIVNMASSMGLVLLLFLFAFRRLSGLLYAFLPLTTGLILTFGFASLAFGTVSSATSGTAALLIGLGIDFTIVLYGRYVEERRRGLDFATALRTSLGTAGPAVVAGTLTTIATFAAFLFTDFPGLRQMGLMAGAGIFFCLLGVLFLLPALLTWSEERHRRRDSEARIYLHSFGADRLALWSFHHPRPVLVVAILLSVGAGLLAPRISYEDSWKSMRPAGSEGMAVEKVVTEHFGSDFDFMMMILRGTDVDALLDRTAEVTERAQSLVREGVVTGISSVTSILPAPSRQREALAWLADRRAAGALDPVRVRADLEAAFAAEGLRPEAFAHGTALLERALTASEPLSLTNMPGDSQAERLLDRVLHQHGDGWQSVVYLYPPAGQWTREAPPQAEKQAAELGPDVILTGANVINKAMRTRVSRDAWFALSLGTLIVFLILLNDFRHLGRALASLIPLALGLLWMFGGMVLLDIPMNFMNMFVATMIIGIGSDYGIHMVHRLIEGQQGGELERGLGETSNAVMLAALTTVVGFGSLITSHFPGMRSMGYVAALGALGTVLAAVSVLPALLGWLRRGSSRAV
jgi:uncharacterized protein